MVGSLAPARVTGSAWEIELMLLQPGPPVDVARHRPIAVVGVGGSVDPIATLSRAGKPRRVVVEDGGFASYLHARPFYQGRWTLAEGALILTTADGVTIRIDDVRCQDTSLTGRSDGGSVEWTAIQPGAM